MSGERLFNAFYSKVITPTSTHNPELTHDALFGALRYLERSDGFLRALRREFQIKDEKLTVNALGIELASPFVLAAGLVKYGPGASFIAALGAGGIEAGTFTWQTREGNPRVRKILYDHRELAVKRIEKFSDGTVINWMGLPNPGIKKGLSNLDPVREKSGVSLGINLAPTPGYKTAEAAVKDLEQSLKEVVAFNPGWVTLNVSCPNIGHQADREERLGEALAIMKGFANSVRGLGKKDRKIPTLVKIGPDMTEEEITRVVFGAKENGFQGIVATNTTIDRAGERQRYDYLSQRGLSGPLLYPLSLRTVEQVRIVDERLGGKPLVVVGCGGIDSVGKWKQMQSAGADFCQLMTGFIFEGPYFFKQMNRDLLAAS